MKIKIDKNKCAGHSRCYSGYPELFGLDEEGETLALNGGEVPKDMEEDLKYAMHDCPEAAIVVISQE